MIVFMAIELNEWPDGNGDDDHGRDQEGPTGMKARDEQALKNGATHKVVRSDSYNKVENHSSYHASFVDAHNTAAVLNRNRSSESKNAGIKFQVKKVSASSKESAPMLNFVGKDKVEEAVQCLASGGSLPYTKEDGKPNHNLMGAAWAALHGGYRGNKYQGADKAEAVSKLKKLYKSEGMDAPAESHADEGGCFLEAALPKSASHSALQDKVSKAINDNIKIGVDMDCDDDGDEDAKQGKYAYVMDMFPGAAVYSMDGKLFQVAYTVDRDDDVHLGAPSSVEQAYVDKEKGGAANEADKGVPMCAKCGGKCPACAKAMAKDESFAESCYAPMEFVESATETSSNGYKVTVIKPGWSKNGRFYSEAMLKKCHGIFEGAKMFADHQTDKESREKPEGSVHNWVASLKNVQAESDGTVTGIAVPIDPAFKTKLETLKTEGLLGQMGISIRALGESKDGEAAGKKGKIVESLVRARSVDFVTFAAAGGGVQA